MSDQLQFPLVWDNTQRVSFVSCPTKFFWAHIRRIASAETSVHLHFGGCYATGMEYFRKAYYSPGETQGDFKAAYAIGARAMTEAWGDYEVNDPKTPKTFDNLCLAYDRYWQQYPPDSDHIQPYITREGKPAVEFRAAIPLELKHPETGEPLVYAVRFDMLGVFRDQLWVVDEKTTTYLGAHWMNQWDLRSQFIGYVWGAREFDHDAQGAVVRGVGVKKSGIDFAEPIVTIQQWKIDRWYEQLHRDLQRAIDCWNSGVWDVNYADACNEYGGCSYKRLCEMGPVNLELWIENYYVPRHWNPLQADPTAPAPTAE